MSEKRDPAATGETVDSSAGLLGLERVSAFSDGVFAIAITLLVIEIKVPAVEHDLAQALLAKWPSYLGYLVSFIIIGIWWVNHHRLFDGFVRADHLLLLLNLFHLMCIAFIPFTTALLAEYFWHGGADERTAAAIYSGTLLLAALFDNAMWLRGVQAGLLSPEMPASMIPAINRLFALTLLVYAIAVGLAFVLPVISIAICLAIAIYYALPGQRVPVL
jgi:uncharacterized membrane protein